MKHGIAGLCFCNSWMIIIDSDVFLWDDTSIYHFYAFLAFILFYNLNFSWERGAIF